MRRDVTKDLKEIKELLCGQSGKSFQAKGTARMKASRFANRVMRALREKS